MDHEKTDVFRWVVSMSEYNLMHGRDAQCQWFMSCRNTQRTFRLFDWWVPNYILQTQSLQCWCYTWNIQPLGVFFKIPAPPDIPHFPPTTFLTPSPSLLQLVLFGLSNQVVVTFKEENTMTFKHLFLKDYDESSDDSFAVYTQNDVYDHVFYAVEQVNHERNEKSCFSIWNHLVVL